MPMNDEHPVRGLWCAMLTPLDARGGVDHARFAATRTGFWREASTASRRSARRAKASRSRWPNGSPALTRCSPRASRRGSVVAATGCAALAGDHRADAARRAVGLRGVPRAAAVLLQGRVRRRPLRVVRAADRGRRRSRSAALPLPHPAGDRRAAVASTWSRGSPRRFPASSPASRTAPATGHTRRHCSRASRSSRSWSATSRTCRA